MNVFRKPLENEKYPNASLYVGNLDPQVSEHLLYELFIQVGPVRLVNLPKDRILRAHQGFGFVEFNTSEDAEFALNILNGVRLYGKTLKMKKTDPTGGQGNDSKPAISVGARLFVKNLSPLVDEKYLKDTFSRFGNLIETPSIVKDENGVSKGHGFIEYDDFDSSDTALAKMDGTLLMNNRIKLAYAYKEGFEHAKLQHGDEVDRTLAQQGKENLRNEKKVPKTKKRRN